MVSEVVRISRNRENLTVIESTTTTTATTLYDKYKLYHGVRLVVKSKEEFYSDRTHTQQQQQQQCR